MSSGHSMNTLRTKKMEFGDWMRDANIFISAVFGRIDWE